MSLIYNAQFDKNTRKLSFEDKAGNEIYSFIVPERAPAVDDINKPLTFKATQDGSTVSLKKNGSPSGSFQTSRDGGNTWTDYAIGRKITLNAGEEVSFRAKSDRESPQDYSREYFYFEMTGKIEAWHNVMSLYRTNDFATYNTTVHSAFAHLFDGCTSLTKAPVLPATTLANYCYDSMFVGCKSLTEAPELPATTLALSCYGSMFRGCQSLTKSPVLPATTLVNSCYWGMFTNCQSLNEVRIAATTKPSSQFSYTLENWLSGVSATGDFYCDPNATIFPKDSVSGIPKGWRRVPPVDDVTKPLTFKATQDGSKVKLRKNGSPSGAFQTSRDGGSTWADYTIDSVITLNTGDEVSFRAKSDRTSGQNDRNYFYFEMTGKIEAWHNVMSMIRTNDFATYKSVVAYAFSRLFMSCTSLTKSPVLPATTLADSCYWTMFQNCRSLVKAPELPATALAVDCYFGMFQGCRSLTEAPELPATTLANRCYYSMFSECYSLVKAPELPATTLERDCYQYMFSGCGSLTKAPELPATTLAQNCYNGMFSGCGSLTKAPELPATTLAPLCYQGMFYRCSKLNEVRIAATTTATDALKEWLSYVSTTGDFYCDPSATIFPSGTSGIPANWNRHALSDYPVTP